MIFTKSCVSALQASIAPLELTSEQLESDLSPLYERLRLPQGRLEMMSGVKARRFWPNGTKPSQIASEAATQLFNTFQIDSSSIELLIHSSVCRDFLEPSTASVVHHNLNLSKNCMIFDLSNACLGMLNAMIVASEMIERGSIKKALVVSGENSAPLIKQTIQFLNQEINLSRKGIKKYFANLTIGSCGMAILLEDKEKCSSSLFELEHATTRTDSSANHLCQGDGGPNSLMMETNSEELMKYGVQLAKENWEDFLEQSQGKSIKEYQSVFCHQVGSAHEKLTLSTLGLEHIQTHRTYPHLGNTGSCALPVTLWEAWKKNKESLSKTRSALLGIGSGLTSTMLGIKWN